MQLLCVLLLAWARAPAPIAVTDGPMADRSRSAALEKVGKAKSAANLAVAQRLKEHAALYQAHQVEPPIQKMHVPFRLLLASAVSQRHLGRVIQAVKETCETHAWVRVVLNVFDADLSTPSPPLRAAIAAARRFATIAAMRGFKLFWWTRLLGPNATAGFTHVWLVDSDMDFRPSQFALETFVRLQA